VKQIKSLERLLSWFDRQSYEEPETSL